MRRDITLIQRIQEVLITYYAEDSKKLRMNDSLMLNLSVSQQQPTTADEKK